jgi:hypothetical protein
MAGLVGLSIRATKEEFMSALGLDARNHGHDYIYQAMRVS